MERFDALAFVLERRNRGQGWNRITAELNERGVPTRSGVGRWSSSSVRSLVDPSGWAAYMRRYRSQWR